jgi:hypothetical protein
VCVCSCVTAGVFCVFVFVCVLCESSDFVCLCIVRQIGFVCVCVFFVVCNR